MIEILQNRGVLSLSGSDAGKLLQSMTTNNVLTKLYSYNYFLTSQGKFLFDFFVYKKSDEFYLLDVDVNSLKDLQKRLTMYKLRSDVDIKDASSDYKLSYSESVINSHVEFSLQDPRCEKLGFRSMFKSEDIGILTDLVEDLYIKDKYQYSIIDGASDLEYERSIPVEYGAEELHAIDYHKGCYIGQEVISRAKYQGVVRKKIFKLESGSDIVLDEPRSQVHDLQGNKLGVVCSSYKNQAIALLREEKILGLEQKTAMINGQKVEIKTPDWRN